MIELSSFTEDIGHENGAWLSSGPRGGFPVKEMLNLEPQG